MTQTIDTHKALGESKKGTPIPNTFEKEKWQEEKKEDEGTVWSKTEERSLYNAVDNNNIENVKSLLAIEPNLINKPADGGDFPLHAAAENGNIEIAKILLQNKAAINAINKEGLSPLMLAIDSGKTNMAKFLINRKVATNIVGIDGNTALHFAAENNNVAIVKILSQHKNLLLIKNKKGQLPTDLTSNNDIKKLLIK